MTRKDYERIARTINGSEVMMAPMMLPGGYRLEMTEEEKAAWIAGARDQRAIIGRYLADAFEQDNPRFDRKRFLEACGL